MYICVPPRTGNTWTGFLNFWISGCLDFSGFLKFLRISGSRFLDL